MGRWLTGWAAVLAAGVMGCNPAAAQRFEVKRSPDIVGGLPQISLTGLPPDVEVDVAAERILVDRFARQSPRRSYRSKARFRADASGSVVLATSPSLDGSYLGADASGLFWSMQATADTPAAAAAAAATGDMVLTASIAGRQVATASIPMAERLPGFEVRDVPGFPGSDFAPHPGPGKHAVIVIVDGADDEAASRDVFMNALAAQGFSVFRFATYSLSYGGGRPTVEGLPTRYVDIPVDRFQGVRDWLARQQGVDAGRIGLYGLSRNGAYVLLAATRFAWVRAVAGIVPSDVVWEGWGDGVAAGTTSSYAWRGRPLPYVPYLDFNRETAKIARREPFRLRTPMDEGRWSHPERVAAARIPVEAYRGPMLVAGGEIDDVWPSGHMAQNIAERRAAAGLDTTLLVFRDAGHGLAGDGLDPTMLFRSGEARGPESHAQQRTWQATMTFLKRTLRPEQTR